MLPSSARRREAFKSDALFRNEVAFYTRALPALLAFEAEAQGGAQMVRNSANDVVSMSCPMSLSIEWSSLRHVSYRHDSTQDDVVNLSISRTTTLSITITT